jgi:DNA-binding winged helix-turn-helix (wHTH) protein/Tol biopolymer transport system component
LSSNGAPQTLEGSRTIRFGEFEADLQSGEVRKAGVRVKLQEQPFKVLQVLLERRGELVTREELQCRIWPEESFGDFDHAVNVAIGKLRTALGDSADNPRFVETIPRRGYRFVAALDNPPSEIAPGVPAAPPAETAQRHGVGRRWLLPAMSAILLAAALLVVGILVGRRSVGTRAPEFQRLTVRHGTVFTARFAPDGHNVIYSASWDGSPVEIYATDVNYSGARSLGLSDASLLAVSSSGEMAVQQSPAPRFMLALRGTLGQVPISGGTPRAIAENVEWADWAPDGKSLAVVRATAGEKEQLEFPMGHVLYETTGWVSHPRVSPKGDQVAFLDHPNSRDDRGVVAVVDLAGHKRVLSTGWESEEGLAWSPRGDEVWFSATEAGLQRRVYAVDLAGHVRLTFRAPGGVTIEDIAPDGRLLLTRDEQRAGIMGLARGATRERDLSWLDWSLPVDLSADGKTVLFDEEGEQVGPNYSVVLRDMNGSPPVPLGEGMAGGLSPDGKWAVATVDYTQLVLLPTGAGSARRIARDNMEQYGHPVRWLADGKRIYFSGQLVGQRPRCFIQSIEGGQPVPITPEGESGCRVSPDGKWMVRKNPSTNESSLYPMEGGPPQPIRGLLPGEGVSWSTDSKFLFVNQWKQLPVKVFRLNIETGQRQLFKEIYPADLTGLCDMTNLLWSADGQSYVYGYTRLLSDLYLVKGLR